LEAELDLDLDSNPDPESDPELITDPDPNLQIISGPAGSGSGCTTLVNGNTHLKYNIPHPKQFFILVSYWLAFTFFNMICIA
jgi:hypothetical protein